MPAIPPGEGCPLLGFDPTTGKLHPCQKFECKLWRPISFDLPEGGKDTDFDCVYVHLMHLQMRAVHEVMGVHSASNSHRNQEHEDAKAVNQNLAELAYLAGAPLGLLRPIKTIGQVIGGKKTAEDTTEKLLVQKAQGPKLIESNHHDGSSSPSHPESSD